MKRLWGWLRWDAKTVCPWARARMQKNRSALDWVGRLYFWRLLGLYMLASSSRNTTIVLPQHWLFPLLIWGAVTSVWVFRSRTPFSSLPLLGVDVAARADLDPPAARIPRPSQNAGQIVLVHEVAGLRPPLLVQLPGVLLLIFRQDQLVPPPVLAASLDIVAFPIGRPVGRLRDAVHVAPVVVLKVLLEVEGEVTRGVGAARDARQGGLAAGRAELFRHVLAYLEAAVAPQDPGFEVGDASQAGVEKT